MKIVITKTVCELVNGDKKVINNRVLLSTDIESYRKQIQKATPDCMIVRFTYEELPI